MKKQNYLLVYLLGPCISSPLFAINQQNFSNCSAEGCHVKQTKFDMVHPPVEENCMNCHKTDSDEHPIKGEKEFSLTTTVPALCYGCHEPNNQMKFVHQPVKDGSVLTAIIHIARRMRNY